MLPWYELLLRLSVAAAIGGLLGWERETAGKPAGFRTVMLVTISSCLFVLTATQAALLYGERVEAGRLMTGIAQGIGFLGAGAIVQSRGQPRWLTTAATLWAAAALGYASALGMYLLAGLGGAIVFITLRWVSVIEDRWLHCDKGQEAAHPDDERRPR
jgi:putative Mg2+ transporter-C (MgtC) family protein